MLPTPGQTVGPFFHDALHYVGDQDLVPPGRADAVVLHGTVRDGSGEGVPDALIEIWQADPHGRVSREPGSIRRDGHTFTGFGRAATDNVGSYHFTTVPPGAVEGRLPFFAVTVFARGLTNRLFTRAYLPLGDAAPDELLRSAGERSTALLCVPDEAGLRFDIVLQGDAESVFLDYCPDARR